jgi:hypothetical protein
MPAGRQRLRVRMERKAIMMESPTGRWVDVAPYLPAYIRKSDCAIADVDIKRAARKWLADNAKAPHRYSIWIDEDCSEPYGGCPS